MTADLSYTICMNMDRIARYQLFVRVVELGSFTAAGLELGLSQPTISRQISALEAHLGCLLLQRTTRAITLTSDGEKCYNEARKIIDAVNEVESQFGTQKSVAEGRLRLTCAAVMGRLHILPQLPRFLAKYPQLQVDLRLNDHFVDMVEEGIDLAIRVGDIDNPQLIARRVGTTRRIVVASPKYLEKFGCPEHPRDLAHHNCVVYSRLTTGPNWPFMVDGENQMFPISGPFSTNNTEGVRAAILQGLGIGLVPEWHFTDGELQNGVLIPLLEAFQPLPNPIHLVYPSRRHFAQRMRVMIDFLVEFFQGHPQFGALPQRVGAGCPGAVGEI